MDLCRKAWRSAYFAGTPGAGLAGCEPDRFSIPRAVDQSRAPLTRGMGAGQPAAGAARSRQDCKLNICAQLSAPAAAGLEQAAGQQLVRTHGAGGAATAL